MKQSFCINQQGPSHGPEWKRPKPHTLIYHNKTRSHGSVTGLIEEPSAVSLTYSQKAFVGAYKKRMTEITLLASEQEKSWRKIQLYQPVLSTNRMLCSFNPMQSVTQPTDNQYYSNPLSNEDQHAGLYLCSNETFNRTHNYIKTSATPTRQQNSREQSFVKTDKLNVTQDTIPTQLTTVSNSRATLSNNPSAFLFAQDSSKPNSSICTPKL